MRAAHGLSQFGEDDLVQGEIRQIESDEVRAMADATGEIFRKRAPGDVEFLALEETHGALHPAGAAARGLEERLTGFGAASMRDMSFR